MLLLTTTAINVLLSTTQSRTISFSFSLFFSKKEERDTTLGTVFYNHTHKLQRDNYEFKRDTLIIERSIVNDRHVTFLGFLGAFRKPGRFSGREEEKQTPLSIPHDTSRPPPPPSRAVNTKEAINEFFSY